MSTKPKHYPLFSLFCGFVLFMVSLAALSPVAQAASNIIEFPIPTASSRPAEMTIGPDGNLWFTEQDSNKIGRITPTGTFTEFPVPTASSAPTGIVTGPDNNLWFTKRDTHKIGRLTPAGVFSEFSTGLTVNSSPLLISTGPDGNLWFTENDGNKIGRITPAGLITEFNLPIAGSRPSVITSGPDGNLWFTEADGNKIGKITPAGLITEFPIPTTNSLPVGICTGPDGNLWFVESSGNKIGKISTAGVISEIDLPTANSRPGVIITGPDNKLWFVEQLGNKIGTLTNLTVTPDPLIVNRSGDDGAGTQIGTLSYALKTAQVGQNISFNLAGEQKVSVSGVLPPLKPGVNVTAPCVAGKPAVTIDGSSLAIIPKTDGLVISGGSRLTGLRITNFSGSQIRVSGPGNHLICIGLQR